MNPQQQRKARRLSILLRWALEDYSYENANFQEVLQSDDFIATLDPIEDKFFYSVAFLGPMGSSNDIIAEDLYRHLRENLPDEVSSDLGGIAVNFVGGAYGQ